MLRTLRFALLASFAFAATSVDAADLKGKFVLTGDVPAPTPITDGKAESDFPGQKLTLQNLVVDPTSKGIANIAVYVRTADVAATPAAEKALAPTVAIDNKGGQFHPHMVGLWSGKQKLVFKNSDPVSHNSNFAFAGVNPLLTPNSEQEIPVSGVKLLPQELSCSIHPWMKAFVIVRDNPYVAVSGADGSFALKDLPTGTELEIQVWHERAGFLVAKPEWAKGRFTVTLSADQDLGEISVDPKLFK